MAKVGMTVAEYALHRGVSRIAVYKAIKEDRITVEKDGSLIPAKADLQWDTNTDPRQQRDTALRDKESLARRPVDPAAAAEFGIDLGAAARARSAHETMQKARAANEVIKVSRGRIALETQRQRLVDKPKSVAEVYDAMHNVRDSWQNWPARVAALMAADLRVDTHAVQIALEKYVRMHLEDMGDIVFAYREPGR